MTCSFEEDVMHTVVVEAKESMKIHQANHSLELKPVSLAKIQLGVIFEGFPWLFWQGLLNLEIC